LKLSPADTNALKALRASYGPDRKGALAKIKEYVALQPESSDFHELLGDMLLAEGDVNGASKAFSEASLADPKSLRAELGLVQIDLLQNRAEQGQKRLEKLLASGSDTPEVQLWLGNIELTKGDWKKAAVRFQTVINLESDNAQALNNLAWSLAQSNETNQALKYAQRAVEIDPENVQYNDTLGWILYQKGLYSASLPHLEQAGKRSAASKYRLAMAYAKSGNVARGKEALRAAQHMNPNLPEAKSAQKVVDISQ